MLFFLLDFVSRPWKSRHLF